MAPGDDAAAAGNYAAPSDDVPVYAEEELGGYAGDEAGDPALDMLLKSIPGVPGEDYPIYAEVPETAFACDGQVDGGEFEIFLVFVVVLRWLHFFAVCGLILISTVNPISQSGSSKNCSADCSYSGVTARLLHPN